MSSRDLMLAAAIAMAVAGAACTQERANEATKAAGDAADRTKAAAGNVAAATKDVAVTTGEAISDAWITSKISAKFVDEKLLDGSSINVDTNDHVVTLKGTVGSAAAKDRAAAIAGGTEGV